MLNYFTKSFHTYLFFIVTTIFLALSGTALAVPTITTVPTLFGPYCNNDTSHISVVFTYTGTFTGLFKVQISNASGVFPTDFTTGILGSDTASPIAAVVPVGLTAGTAYRIRVINQTPSPTFGSNNGSNITILGYPVVPAIAGFRLAGLGGTVSLSDNVAGGTWSSSDTTIAKISATGLVTGVALGTDSIYYSVTNTCGLTTTINKLISVVPLPGITSVTPNTGVPGATVTISGTNFNSTATSNALYFGSTKAAISSASATSITAALPVNATYNSLTLADTTTGFIATEQYAFLPTYHNSGLMADSVHFNAPVNFAADASPIGAALGDIDGDGKTDMVVVNSGPNNIYVYLNQGTGTGINSGTFAAPLILSTGFGPHYVKIADIDGDGRPDILVTNTSTSSNKISIFRNISTPGTLTFAARVDINTGGTP